MADQPQEKKDKYSWDETIRTVLIAFVLALAFRSLAFEPFHIPSASMKSNLLIGDYLFVSKYTYGYSRYSFPFGLPLFKGRIMELDEPQRGDVVVFREPANPRIDFIKRIIGMPGDRIQMKDGILYINGEAVKRKPIEDFTDIDAHGSAKSVAHFAETLPEGKVIGVLKQYRFGPADNTPVYHVPPKHYFMMGDNRDMSHDSRFPDLGYVPEENLVGRAEIIFFSTDGSAEWPNPLSWFSAMRLNRFFKRIE